MTISVLSAESFAADDFVVVGIEGSEQAEMCRVVAVGTGYIEVQTLLKNHLQDEPITKYKYNQRKFYGSLTSGGTYHELTSYGSPANIEVSDPQGTYFEYTGTEGYVYFKSTYYNTTDTTETDITDAAETYADETERYCSIYAIKKQAGLTQNPYIGDAVIEQYRKRAEAEVNSFLNAKYFLPLTNSQGIREIPFAVENCTVLLAAGYADWQEFGKDGEGFKWMADARKQLKQIQSPGGQQLIGSDFKEMQNRGSSSGVQSYPDMVDNANGPTQSFTMMQKF